MNFGLQHLHLIYAIQFATLGIPGSEMLDGKGENEIDSSMARIRVEDDWTDGLTSRYVTTRTRTRHSACQTCKCVPSISVISH